MQVPNLNWRADYRESQSADTTWLSCICANSVPENDQNTKDSKRRRFHEAGTLSLLVVRVASNTLNVAATYRTASGVTPGTNGNCVITVPAGQTGTFTDDSNTDAVAANDLWAFKASVPVGTGAIEWSGAGIVYEATNDNVTLLGSNFSADEDFRANGTYNLPAAGDRLDNSTEARVQNYITGSGGTWQNLGVGTAGILTTTITVTVRSRINGVNGNQVLTFTQADNSATFKQDVSNTDTVAQGDRINVQFVTTGSTADGGTFFEWIQSQIDHAANDEGLMLTGGSRFTVVDGSTWYWPASGGNRGAATESETQHPARVAMTVDRLGGFISQSSGGTSLTLRFRKNGQPGNNVVTIDPGVASSGFDASNTDEVDATDLIGIQVVGDATGTNARLQSTSMRITPASAATPPAGQALEVEQAFAASASKLKTAGQALDTEQAFAASGAKLKTAGQALETEQAFAASASKLKVVGQAIEVEQAFAASGAKLRLAGQAQETEIALAAVPPGAVPVGQASETEQVFAAAAVKRKAAGQASESEAAFATSASKRKTVGQVTETEQALAAAAAKALAAAVASETEQAFGAVSSKRKAGGQAVEIEIAFAVASQSAGEVDIRERCYAAVFALLSGIEGVVFTARNPDDNLEPEKMPALIQLDGGHRVIEELHGADEYAALVEFEIYVTAQSSAALLPAFNLLLARLTKTLFENRTLGSLAQDIRHTGLEDPELDRSEDGGPFAAGVASYEIRYATREGDPFNLPT